MLRQAPKAGRHDAWRVAKIAVLATIAVACIAIGRAALYGNFPPTWLTP